VSRLQDRFVIKIAFYLPEDGIVNGSSLHVEPNQNKTIKNLYLAQSWNAHLSKLKILHNLILILNYDPYGKYITLGHIVKHTMYKTFSIGIELTLW